MAMYTNRSPIFGIPYIADGEVLNQASELQRTTMIENLLFLGTNGVPKAVMQEGSYNISTIGGITTVTLSASPTYSILGVVNYMLVKSMNTITFTGMTSGNNYYLYIKYSDALRDDASTFDIEVSTTLRTSNSYLLLATIDTFASTPTMNTNPSGKLYVQDFSTHTINSINPHGQDLTQSNFIVTSSLKLKDHFINETIYLANVFNGATGQIVSTPGKTPIFANVMPTSSGHGEIWCTLQANSVTVFNSGSASGGFEIEIKVS